MLKWIGKWFRLYEDEIGYFLSAALLLFLLRISAMLFNNFAETAFLKRFGVEYLPIMYMVNSLAIFFVMGFMTGFIARIPGTKLLSNMLVFCGISVAGARFLIPLGFDLLYPVLFTMKTLYEALLALLFWNIANDLFNTRQSKRLFPLIVAGGVCGDILGGFGTPLLVKILTIDNLLLGYMVSTLLGALVVRSMGTRYPTLLIRKKSGEKGKQRSSIIQEIKKAVPLVKESLLAKILILMTFLPNIVIPIMNYQFNFVINEQFATEGGLVTFLGYFRGSMNVVSLFILFFVGRIYGRWGLPIALMFHPANYLFVFVGFLLRFDVFAAIYARLSTNVIRTTLNKPASDVLMGLIPVSARAVLRPFLRGTVVRIALLIGSGSILLTSHLFHPRYLALVGLPFVVAWFATIVFLKMRYSKILLDLISKNMLDLKSMEESDIGELFRDRQIREQMVTEFLSSSGRDILWYGGLMKDLGFEELDKHILAAMGRQDEEIRIGLIDLLSSKAGAPAVPILLEAAESDSPDLTVAALKALNRLPESVTVEVDFDRFLTSEHPEIKAQAAVGKLFHFGSDTIIARWLNTDSVTDRKAGVIAAGESGNPGFLSVLVERLNAPANESILPETIRAISQVRVETMNSTFIPYLIHPDREVRFAALNALEIHDDESLRAVIAMLADTSDKIRERVKEKIEQADYQNGLMMIEFLNAPQRRVRETIFEIMETLRIQDVEAFRFAREQVARGYQYLAESERLKKLPESPARDILVTHLEEKRKLQLEITLRVLAAQDRSEQMAIVSRGVFSPDPRQQANAVEAIEDILDRSLTKILVPLLEMSSTDETLAIGQREFKQLGIDGNDAELMDHLLEDPDRVTVVLALAVIQNSGPEYGTLGALNQLASSEDREIRRVAESIIQQNKGKQMPNEVTVSDTILLLRGIDIFEGLAVSELAAVASVTKEVDFPPEEIVIQEGDAGENLYLVIQGEVAVIKGLGEENEFELDRIKKGDYFGEMALFEDIVRTASIRTVTDSRLLLLNKEEFKEIVREYPQIALEICKVLSGRIRRLHKMVRS